jgi:hypothetical protein
MSKQIVLDYNEYQAILDENKKTEKDLKELMDKIDSGVELVKISHKVPYSCWDKYMFHDKEFMWKDKFEYIGKDNVIKSLTDKYNSIAPSIDSYQKQLDGLKDKIKDTINKMENAGLMARIKYVFTKSL